MIIKISAPVKYQKAFDKSTWDWVFLHALTFCDSIKNYHLKFFAMKQLHKMVEYANKFT